jgi:hypothetical protein
METYPFTGNAIFKEFRHSRILLAGIQRPELDPRLNQSGVTHFESHPFHPTQGSKGVERSLH